MVSKKKRGSKKKINNITRQIFGVVASLENEEKEIANRLFCEWVNSIGGGRQKFEGSDEERIDVANWVLNRIDEWKKLWSKIVLEDGEPTVRKFVNSIRWGTASPPAGWRGKGGEIESDLGELLERLQGKGNIAPNDFAYIKKSQKEDPADIVLLYVKRALRHAREKTGDEMPEIHLKGNIVSIKK